MHQSFQHLHRVPFGKHAGDQIIAMAYIRFVALVYAIKPLSLEDRAFSFYKLVLEDDSHSFPFEELTKMLCMQDHYILTNP